jgi:YcaO-like protein with predicted kinase domain
VLGYNARVSAEPARIVQALRPVAEAIGVTRVARLTGLDRAGVEVACAIRPGGHVLQASNGKGETFAHAAASAVSEAAELWASERPDPLRLVYGSLAEVSARAQVISPEHAGSAGSLIAPRLWSARTRIGWVEGTELVGRSRVLVPAQAVYCPPAGGAQLGPSLVAWTTNGLAAHRSRSEATLHALLEAAERDQLDAALPQGWTPAEVKRRLLAPAAVRRLAPRASSWAQAISARGFDVHLFNLSPGGGSGLGLAVAGALLFDQDEGPLPLTAGYACRAGRQDALLAALFEAAQSRLTDVHGAREDVAPADRAAARRLREHCRRAGPGQSVATLPEVKRLTAAALVKRFASRGHRRVAVVDVGRAGGLHVVKVLVPSFRRSPLL